MEVVQLYDKFDEVVVGTVMLKEGVEFDTIANAWDEYQKEHNFGDGDEPDIYEFAELNNNICEVLYVMFYQPAND